MSSKTKIIEAENLTKVYKGKVKAVDHISFYVEEGEIFGFLGPNGAGKTTTIKMLNTLASITEGRATVAGKDVSKDPAAVRDVIGVVPQELTADDELKGIENLLLSARLHHVPSGEARKRAKDLLTLVDLENSAEQARQDLLRRDAQAAPARDRPHPHPEDTLPRRAHPGPRHPDEDEDVGVHGQAQQGERADHLHDDPLPRGGGRPLQQGRDHRPRRHQGLRLPLAS